MIRFLAGFVGKLSGPMLVYVLIGLIASNALTGYLLKKSLTRNAQAILQCENQALRDANDANVMVLDELARLQVRHDAYRDAVKNATREVEEKTATDRRAMEVDHEKELNELEVANNEIPDEEFFCASEPISAAVVDRMRIAVTAYNENKNRPDH